MKIRLHIYLTPVILLLLVVFSLRLNAQPGAVTVYSPLGKLVDIGGWRLHLIQAGQQNSGPSVILEAGVGDFSFDWNLVQSKVARYARVYSYDRAGYAWSDMGPKPHTMHQDVYNLHALLEKVKAPKPYILVGASYGAFLVRLFAQEYPGEVVGIILVDGGYEDYPMFINGKQLQPSIDAKGVPIPPVKTTAGDTDNVLKPETAKFIGDLLTQQGFPPTTLDSPYQKLPADIQKIRLWALGKINYYAVNDNDYYIEEAARLLNARNKDTYMFNNKPLLILTQGIFNDTDRINKQKQLLSLSHNSKQIVDSTSGHHMQLEDPDFVIESIKRVMKAISNHKPLDD